MLQRIQTVYLLLIAALMAAMAFFPLAVIRIGEDYWELNVFGLTRAEELKPLWGLFALTAIIVLLAIVTVLLYKKRMLQIRICIFNGIMMAGFYGLFAFMVYMLKQPYDALSVKFALAFPLVCLILDYLAIRNIGADEVLVRSLDRLR